MLSQMHSSPREAAASKGPRSIRKLNFRVQIPGKLPCGPRNSTPQEGRICLSRSLWNQILGESPVLPLRTGSAGKFGASMRADTCFSGVRFFRAEESAQTFLDPGIPTSYDRLKNGEDLFKPSQTTSRETGDIMLTTS